MTMSSNNPTRKQLQSTAFSHPIWQSHDMMSIEEAWTSNIPSGLKFHYGDRGVVAKLGGTPPI